jgi:hypothetical protein
MTEETHEVSKDIDEVSRSFPPPFINTTITRYSTDMDMVNPRHPKKQSQLNTANWFIKLKAAGNPDTIRLWTVRTEGSTRSDRGRSEKS